MMSNATHVRSTTVNPFVDLTPTQRVALTKQIIDVFSRATKAMSGDEVCSTHFPDTPDVAHQHIDKLARAGILRRQPRPGDLRFVYWLAGTDAAPPLLIPCKQADGSYSQGADSPRPSRRSTRNTMDGTAGTTHRPQFIEVNIEDRRCVAITFPHLSPLALSASRLNASHIYALRFLRLFRQNIDLDIARIEQALQHGESA